MAISFKGAHFPKEVILMGVHWYVAYPLSTRNEEHGTAVAIRKIKYLNNIVEQDHRGVKRVTLPMLGFKSFDAAQGTLVGIELMHMIKKKQLVVEAGDEGLTED